ncbi:MAG: hypothetical protein R2838_11200 [Caldilineaceae bacterium]
MEETVAYVLREMTAPDGGFYSTQDADSEGEEGKFFVWTPQEIEAVLGPQDGRHLRGLLRCLDPGQLRGQEHSQRGQDGGGGGRALFRHHGRRGADPGHRSPGPV